MKKTASKSLKPKQVRTANARTASQAAKVQAAAPGWASLRLRYTATPRKTADSVAESGLTLRDLMAIELAEHESIRAELVGEESTRVRATLYSCMVQCRKALRALVLASGGAQMGEGDRPVRVPDGMSVEDFDAALERIGESPDEIMS